MKKIVLVITLAAFALSGAAIAQVDPSYKDNIGVYTDEAGTENCVTLANGEHTVYLVLTKMTNDACAGWESKISFDNMFLTGFAHRGQAVDVGSRPDEHIVGYADPLPASIGAGGYVVVVADLEILILDDSQPSYMYSDEVYFSLLENGLPAYLDGNSGGHSLHPAFGDVGDPMFIVNGDCGPVATEDSSFGSVKSLFR